MVIPKVQKLSNGVYSIRLRLNGQNHIITGKTKSECQKKVKKFKLSYLSCNTSIVSGGYTLRTAIDNYISIRNNILSPSTIRSYRSTQKNRFQSVMDRRIDSITNNEWQTLINLEAKNVGYKVIKNAIGFIRSVCAEQGVDIGKLILPTPTKSNKPFLNPEEIKVFVAAVADTQYAVPALLALSSLRISEISALQWEDIPTNTEFIQVKSAVVPNEHNQFVFKKTNKNASSTRKVLILIPELAMALERDRKKEGPVLTMRQNSLFEALTKIYKKNNLPQVGIHGLRHSFASLCYHLKVPERITMEIGGWSDTGTMNKIYTHIAQSDITHYKGKLYSFYRKAYSSPENIIKRIWKKLFT